MVKDKLRLLILSLGEDRVKQSVSFLGQTVDAFYIATSARELVKAVGLCQELDLDFLVVGSGTKVKPSDLVGVIIKNRSDELRIFGVKGKISRDGLGIEEAFIEAGAGVVVSSLLEYAKKQGLGGLERLQALNGTIGGSFYFGPEIRELACQVKILNTMTRQEELDPKDVKDGDIILSVIFHLKTNSAKNE